MNIEAEGCVLGGCLLASDAYWKAAHHLPSADAFYGEDNRVLWEVFSELKAEGVEIDAVTVMGKLLLQSHQVSASYIAELTSLVPTSANVEHYAEIVADEHRRDVLQLLMAQGSQRITKAGNVETEFLEIMHAMLQQLGSSHGTHSVPKLLPAHDKWIEEMEDRSTEPGLRLGIDLLDNKMPWGVQSDQLVIVAGRPSSGKTAFALSVALNLALDYRKPVFIGSAETGAGRLMQRLNANICPVERYREAHAQRRREPLLRLMKEYRKHMENLPIYIDDGSRYMEDMCMSVRRHCAKHPDTAAVFLDYLQFFRLREKGANKEYERISALIRMVTALNKSIPCPVFLLSQLNRGDYDKERGPDLTNLRGSGEIEQDADTVIFLHPRGPDEAVEVETLCKIAKQREGPRGEALLSFMRPQALYLGKKLRAWDNYSTEEQEDMF